MKITIECDCGNKETMQLKGDFKDNCLETFSIVMFYEDIGLRCEKCGKKVYIG